MKFGDILINLIESSVSATISENKSKVEEFPVKLALLGYPYSGKSCHAGRIKIRYDVDLIEVKDLVHFANKAGLLSGGVVSDEEIVENILHTIQNCKGQGWILLDFPKTLNQCELLEKALSGYTHPLHSGITEKEKKIKESSLLFPPEHPKVLPKEYNKSGIDYAVLLNCDKYECLRRCFGRRIDKKTGMVYQVEDDPPSFNESPLVQNLEPEDNFSEHRGCIVDRIVAFEDNKKEVKNWFSQFRTDENSCLVEVDSNRPIIEVSSEIESIVSSLIKANQEKKLEQERSELEQAEIKRLKELAASEKVSRKRESLLMLEEDDKENALAPDVDEDTPLVKKEKVDGTWEFWETALESYKKVIFTVFSQEQNLRAQFMKTLKAQQLDFIEFLNRPSEKQELILQFQQNFNAFSDENPDMREDPATINELHLRTEDLCNALWDIIEKRQHEAEDEMKEITKSGQVEGHIDIVVGHFQLLISAEYHKYFAACQIIADYYTSLEQKKLYKCEAPVVEFNLESANPIEAIEKMCEKILSIPQYSLVPEEDKDAKDPKNKKKDVKGAKKEEEKLERTEFEIEMDECLKKEYEVLVSRIERIRIWCKNRVKEIEQESSKVYHQLEKWINVSIYAENKAVEVLSSIIREAIEDKAKLQFSLELKTIDTIINQSFIHFQILPTPPPPPNNSVNYTRIWSFTDKENDSSYSKRKSPRTEDRQMTERKK